MQASGSRHQAVLPLVLPGGGRLAREARGRQVPPLGPMGPLVLLLLLRDEQDEQEDVERQEERGLEDERLERRQRGNEVDVADEGVGVGVHGGPITEREAYSETGGWQR